MMSGHPLKVRWPLWRAALVVALAVLAGLSQPPLVRAADALDGQPDAVYQRERSALAAAPVQRSAQRPVLAEKMSLDLRETTVSTALRLVSEVSRANIVATQAAGVRTLSLYMADTTAGEALEAVARAAGLWVRWRPDIRTFMLMTADEYQRDLTVFAEEQTVVLTLRHHNVISAANALRAMFGARVLLQAPVEESLGERMKTTDLRRSDESGRQRNGSASGSDGALSSEAQAAGVTRTQRGGTGRRAAGQDSEEAQIAAAARQAGASDEQMQAAQQGQKAPLYVTYNRQHNLLVLRSGDERVLAQAQRLIAQIDLPTRQVLLEMRVVQVQLSDEYQRAFDLDFFGTGAATGVATTATNKPLNALTGATTVYDASGNLISPRQVGSLGVYDTLDRTSGLFQFLNNRIRARLQLLEEKGQVQTLARPLLLASNNEPARLFIGEEVVLVTGASAQTTTGTTGATNTTITAETEQRDIGTRLVIHPRINQDRSVTLTIDQESSERVVGGTTIPLATGNVGDGVVQYPIDTVTTSSVQVVAQAQDGLTIAVGGMIKINKTTNTANVPGLSKIPLLGELFKRDERINERTELMLIITPHVLESTEEGDRLTRQMGGPAVKSASLSLNRGETSDPTKEARLLAQLALEGLGEANPGWELDPNVRREPVQGWSERPWPQAGEGMRSSLRGVWRWGGMTAVALELSHDRQAALAALGAGALPGAWVAVALEEQPRASEEGVFTRRVVLVTKDTWAETARRWQP